MTSVVTPGTSYSCLAIRSGGHSERKGRTQSLMSHTKTAGRIKYFLLSLSEWSDSGVAYNFDLL